MIPLISLLSIPRVWKVYGNVSNCCCITCEVGWVPKHQKSSEWPDSKLALYVRCQYWAINMGRRVVSSITVQISIFVNTTKLSINCRRFRLNQRSTSSKYKTIMKKILLYNNTHSNDIVNAASNISYRPLLETTDTGWCYRLMFVQFFLWTSLRIRATPLGLHLSIRAENETRYIQYGRFFCFNSTVSYTYSFFISLDGVTGIVAILRSINYLLTNNITNWRPLVVLKTQPTLFSHVTIWHRSKNIL